MLAHLIKRQQSRSIHLRQADKEKEEEKAREGKKGEKKEEATRSSSSAINL